MVTVKGVHIEWHEHLTVRDVLKQLGYESMLVFVCVNDKRLKVSEWDTYSIPDGATVDINKIVLGG